MVNSGGERRPGQEAIIVKGELDLHQGARTIARHWWILFLAGILGGTVGLLVSLAVPPVYKAEALAVIAVDYSRTEAMDENVERQIYLRVQDVLLSDEVLSLAQERTNQQHEGRQDLSLEELRRTIRLFDFGGRWSFEVLDRDPRWAATAANEWIVVGTERIVELGQYAWTAAQAQSLFFQSACRPDQIGEGGLLWVCTGYEPQDGDGEPAHEAVQAANQSLGIPPVLTVGIVERAQVPSAREYRGRVESSLAGALAGLVLGTGYLLAVGPGPARRSNRSEAA